MGANHGRRRIPRTTSKAASDKLRNPELATTNRGADRRTTEPHSAWWGDGAAAAVIGPVADGKGLLASTHRCDGTGDRALVLGAPGQRWWAGGELTTYAHDRTHTRAMMLGLLDRGRDVILDALDRASLTAREVGFFAAHQSTAWLARVTLKGGL